MGIAKLSQRRLFKGSQTESKATATRRETVTDAPVVAGYVGKRQHDHRAVGRMVEGREDGRKKRKKEKKKRKKRKGEAGKR